MCTGSLWELGEIKKRGIALGRLVLARAAALSLKTVSSDHGHWRKRLALWGSCLDGREGSLQTVFLSVHRGSDVHPSSERLGGMPEVLVCVYSLWWPQWKQIRDWACACDSTAICDSGLRRQHCHGGTLEETLGDFCPFSLLLSIIPSILKEVIVTSNETIHALVNFLNSFPKFWFPAPHFTVLKMYTHVALWCEISGPASFTKLAKGDHRNQSLVGSDYTSEHMRWCVFPKVTFQLAKYQTWFRKENESRFGVAVSLRAVATPWILW